MAENHPRQATLGDLVRSVARHKGKAVCTFLAISAAATAYTVFAPRVYRSEAKLLVRLGRENATLDPTAALGQDTVVAVPFSREDEVNSVVELLRSRALAERAVDTVGPAVVLGTTRDGLPPAVASAEASAAWLDAARTQVGVALADADGRVQQLAPGPALGDRDRAIRHLAKSLNVQPVRRSNVIDVTYDGPAPDVAQSVLGRLIDLYLDENIHLNRPQASHAFLAEQTEKLRSDLARLEERLRDLKNSTGLASPDEQRKLTVGRIARLEDELLEAESARTVSEAKVQAWRAKLAELPDTEVVGETTGFGDQGTDAMRGQLYGLLVQEHEAATKYSEEHPKMQEIRRKNLAAKELLGQEEPTRKQVTTARNRMYEQTQQSLLAEEPLLASYRVRAETLRAQLAEVRRQLQTLNENEMQIVKLQREIQLQEANYRKYSANLEQARIDQERESQRMSNIAVAQPASYDVKPVRPRTALNLLGGLALGMFGAVGVALSCEWLRRPARRPEGNQA